MHLLIFERRRPLVRVATLIYLSIALMVAASYFHRGRRLFRTATVKLK